MADQLKDIASKAGRNYDSPPLHLWHPPLSGTIDIVIDKEGRWFHEGDRIERESIVRLFASILRREDDGEYYLVTPGEKWRIEVELLPLIVTDIEWGDDAGEQCLLATLNTGKVVAINKNHPLYLEGRMDDIAAVSLPNGLAALFSRAAWYRLVDLADEGEGGPSITSAGEVFELLSG